MELNDNFANEGSSSIFKGSERVIKLLRTSTSKKQTALCLETKLKSNTEELFSLFEDTNQVKTLLEHITELVRIKNALQPHLQKKSGGLKINFSNQKYMSDIIANLNAFFNQELVRYMDLLWFQEVDSRINKLSTATVELSKETTVHDELHQKLKTTINLLG